MPNFAFKARNRQGETLVGERMADSRQALALALRREQIFLLEAQEKKVVKKSFEFGGNPTPKDVAVFTRQFSVMIDAGVPLVQCIELLASTQANKKFAVALKAVQTEVESGNSLAASMKTHPKIFDDLYVNMVQAGETGGVLNAILNRIALFIEKANKLKKKVKGAMIYPCTIIFVAIVVVAILLIFVIPVFAELYGSMGKALPAPTQITINISNWFRANILYMVFGLAGIIVGIRSYYQTDNGQMNIDRLLLRLPVVGDLLRKVAVARFSQNMAILLSSGVPILDGLAITARTAGNRVIEKAIMDSRVSISQGRTVAEPLRESKIFPPMVCQMVAVGENTGGLDNMLRKVAELYEDEVDDAVANLTALMEPMIMVVLGVILGGLVISMYLPIFQLGSVVS